MKHIKSYRLWESEDSQEDRERTERDLNRMLRLGLIDKLEFTRGIKSLDLQVWADRFYADLEDLCKSEPDSYLFVSKDTYFNTIELTVASGVLNLPENHYNDYSYELADADAATIVIGLKSDSTVEIRATYVNADDDYYNEDYDEEDDEDEDEDEVDSYDGTWWYKGEINIATVDDLMEVIESFNSDETLGDVIDDDGGDWYHD